MKSTEALSTPLFVDLIHQCRTVNNKLQKHSLEKIVLKLADHTHLSAVATEMHILAALTPVRSKSPCYQSVGLNSRAARAIRILFL